MFFSLSECKRSDYKMTPIFGDKRGSLEIFKRIRKNSTAFVLMGLDGVKERNDERIGMKILIVANAHMYKTADGKYYSAGVYNADFFQRYLQVFEKVRVVSKVRAVDVINASEYPAIDDERVEIFDLPWYGNLREAIRNLIPLLRRVRSASEDCDCSVLRVFQYESVLAYFVGKIVKKPFAVEVVNDPMSLIRRRGLSRFLRIRIMKRIVKRANGVSYVTRSYLQKRYPSIARIRGETRENFESYYSSIALSSKDLSKPRVFNNTFRLFRLIHVANNITDDSKGHKTVIRAVKALVDNGINVTVSFIGDGDYVSELTHFADLLGVSDKVTFLGRKKKKSEIMILLKQSDLFIFPTLSEGLPRSLIEAMAAGLPCLSTAVGGIPEILESKYLFLPTDHEGLASKIAELMRNPQELEAMSKKNCEVAREFVLDEVNSRAREFFSKLRRLIESYQGQLS